MSDKRSTYNPGYRVAQLEAEVERLRAALDRHHPLRWKFACKFCGWRPGYAREGSSDK